MGAFVPNGGLLVSSPPQDASMHTCTPSLQSGTCISVPEIEEIERLLPKFEGPLRTQLSADAPALTKRPATKERRLPLRRSVTDTAILRYPPRQSLRREIEHAAAETWLITRLTFSLLTYLGLGYRWITKLMALGLYALCLMPGFLQIGYYYFFSNCVHRSITYGDKPRNRLDFYLPEDRAEPKTVVVFITGGAWIIGYKAWGSLLGQQLVERDVIVACIDYRNFPQGSMHDMIEDVSKGISYVVNNVTHFGGDPKRLYLAGQSAGAHLAAQALVEQAERESRDEHSSLPWRASQFQAFIGISGGYNLCVLVDHFHIRGLYRSLFMSIVEGEENLEKFSPELEVQSSYYRDAVKYLPHMALFHGDADYSIPVDSSVRFAEALHSVGVKVSTRFYPGKTHTDLILQDPMRGGRDELLEDVLEVLDVIDDPADAGIWERRRMVPEILLQMARRISPF